MCANSTCMLLQKHPSIQIDCRFVMAAAEHQTLSDLVDWRFFPQDFVEEIQGIIDQTQVKGSKVSAADRILKALEDRKLLWRTQSPPEMV